MNRIYSHLPDKAALACMITCLSVATCPDAMAQGAVPLGTKTLYSTVIAGRKPDIPAPAGYTPFFINYAGRHGARHVTNLKELTSLDRFLSAAAETKSLRTDGVRLQKMVRSLLEVEKKSKPGTLSGIGEAEQYGIGKRMGQHYPAVVRAPDDCLQVTTTPEERTVQSADQFLRGIAASTSCLTRVAGDSIHLRFFSISPAYFTFSKKGAWKVTQDRLESSDALKSAISSILHRLFDTTFVSKLEQGQFESYDGPGAFTASLYSAAVIVPGLAEEIRAAGENPSELDIFSLLSQEEARQLAFVDASKDFLAKGPGVDLNGIQVRVAGPLLADFLQSSDQWLAGGKKGADLRFAHAETIAPIAALMGLEGASTAVTDPFRYSSVWKVGQVIGYSANIQWVFYRRAGANGDASGGSGGQDVDYLVKILYNESPVHIPVKTTQYPYYHWKDVRKYYARKLGDLGLDASKEEDLYGWLMNLK